MEDTEDKAIGDWERVVYRIMVEDIQNIAIERFGRELTDEEIVIVEDKFPDGVNWGEAIEFAISYHLDLEVQEESEDDDDDDFEDGEDDEEVEDGEDEETDEETKDKNVS